MSKILVILEQAAGKWHKMSWETLTAAQQIGKALGFETKAAVLGHGIASLAAEVPGATIAVDHELLAGYTADAYASAAEQLVRAESPALVLFPHTYQVRDFAPKVATRFGTALVSDVVRVKLDGGLTLVRQLFQGKLNTDVRVATAPVFASIQAGAYRADDLARTPSEVTRFPASLDAASIRQKPEAPFREGSRAVDLTAADLIVSVGRGIKEKENIAIVEELAKAMGAELAASRPICDSGWLPMERQVGSSGQTVAPKMYMAIGISGAIQHLVGMKGAKTVVAINKDPNAPIFEVADYGICGDLFEVVPALTEEIKKARGL